MRCVSLQSLPSGLTHLTRRCCRSSGNIRRLDSLCYYCRATRMWHGLQALLMYGVRRHAATSSLVFNAPQHRAAPGSWSWLRAPLVSPSPLPPLRGGARWPCFSHPVVETATNFMHDAEEGIFGTRCCCARRQLKIATTRRRESKSGSKKKVCPTIRYVFLLAFIVLFIFLGAVPLFFSPCSSEQQ